MIVGNTERNENSRQIGNELVPREVGDSAANYPGADGGYFNTGNGGSGYIRVDWFTPEHYQANFWPWLAER